MYASIPEGWKYKDSKMFKNIKKLIVFFVCDKMRLLPSFLNSLCLYIQFRCHSDFWAKSFASCFMYLLMLLSCVILVILKFQCQFFVQLLWDMWSFSFKPHCSGCFFFFFNFYYILPCDTEVDIFVLSLSPL